MARAFVVYEDDAGRRTAYGLTGAQRFIDAAYSHRGQKLGVDIGRVDGTIEWQGPWRNDLPGFRDSPITIIVNEKEPT